MVHILSWSTGAVCSSCKQLDVHLDLIANGVVVSDCRLSTVFAAVDI